MMRLALAIYASLFFVLYLYGLILRLREMRTDLALKGPLKTSGGLALGLASGLMFVACYGYIAQRPILHPWFWAAFLVASVGSLFWSARFVSALQAEHGTRAGLIAYLVNTALVLPMDVTILLYAFCSPQIW